MSENEEQYIERDGKRYRVKWKMGKNGRAEPVESEVK
jgi:hypothetical protein